MKKNEPILIIGYYGIGKSTLMKLRPDLDIIELHGRPDINILQKSIKHIVIMADPEWLDLFVLYGLTFTLILPSKDRLDEFIRNYEKRKFGRKDRKFINERIKNWNDELDKLMNTPTKTIILNQGYLNDVIDELL